jgi:hypothetical protein
MADQPTQVGGGTLPQPTLAEAIDEIRMVLGDVAQVVGNAAANVKGWIVFQPFEDRQRWPRIGDERWQAFPPGKPGPRPLAAQASHMRVRVANPLIHLLQRALLHLDQKRTDRELRREPRGDGMQGQHGRFEGVDATVVLGIQPILGDEEAVGKIEEAGQPHRFRVQLLGRQGGQQNLDGLRIGSRQALMQGPGDVPASLHDGEWFQAGLGGFTESAGREACIDTLNVPGQALDGRLAEQVLQGRALLNRTGRFRKSGYARRPRHGLSRWHSGRPWEANEAYNPASPVAPQPHEEWRSS